MLAEIKELFDKAEGYIKTLEHVDGLFVPSVNQLRYVARHLLDYHTKSDDIEELKRAKRHCQRAIYDAVDVHIQHSIYTIEMFDSDFKNVEISDLFPQYMDMIRAKNDVLKFLEKGVLEKNRVRFYQQAEAHKNTLDEYVSMLPVIREELAKRTKQQRLQAISWWVMFGITVISVIVSVVIK